MRIPLHPAAWIGFFLNCLVAFLFVSALTGIDLSLFSEEEQAILGLVLEKADAIRMIFFAVLAAQAIALGLLATRSPFGLVLAVLGALLMLPGSLFYLIGCLLTHYRNKLLDFAPAPPIYAQARASFASAYAPKMRIISSVSIAVSFLAIYAGWMNAAAICFGVSLAGLYFAVRTRKLPPLAVFDQYFTLTPGIFATGVLVPYNSVKLATLKPDQSITFQVETEKGARALVWSLQSVIAAERREALEELGKALSSHGVPLEQAE